MNTINKAELFTAANERIIAMLQEEDWFERFEQLANEEPDREPMHYENYQEEEAPTFWCEGCEKRVSMDIFAKGNRCKFCVEKMLQGGEFPIALKEAQVDHTEYMKQCDEDFDTHWKDSRI